MQCTPRCNPKSSPSARPTTTHSSNAAGQNYCPVARSTVTCSLKLGRPLASPNVSSYHSSTTARTNHSIRCRSAGGKTTRRHIRLKKGPGRLPQMSHRITLDCQVRLAAATLNLRTHRSTRPTWVTSPPPPGARSRAQAHHQENASQSEDERCAREVLLSLCQKHKTCAFLLFPLRSIHHTCRAAASHIFGNRGVSRILARGFSRRHHHLGTSCNAACSSLALVSLFDHVFLSLYLAARAPCLGNWWVWCALPCQRPPPPIRAGLPFFPHKHSRSLQVLLPGSALWLAAIPVLIGQIAWNALDVVGRSCVKHI